MLIKRSSRSTALADYVDKNLNEIFLIGLNDLDHIQRYFIYQKHVFYSQIVLTNPCYLYHSIEITFLENFKSYGVEIC